MRKVFSVFLFVLLLSGLFFAGFISVGEVQAVSKPSVPQFSVKLIDDSYDVPPTQTTDPYTGETITQLGYRVNKISIRIEIKNLPDGVYYRVQYKGHYEESWTTITSQWHTGFWSNDFVSASKSTYTDVYLSFDSGSSYKLPPSGARLDFRVQALYAGRETWPEISPEGKETGWHYSKLVETQAGDWSSVQTLTLTYETSESSSQTTTSPPPSAATNNSQPQTPNQTQSPDSISSLLAFLLIIGVVFGDIILVVGLFVVLGKSFKLKDKVVEVWG